MAVNETIDPRVRLAISQWPEDAPRGAVSTFCSKHGISRKSFYELRKRVKADGPAAVLEPRSRRPRSTPLKLTDQVKAEAVQVSAALEASGLDHGPISVHDKVHAMGLEVVPSVASSGPDLPRGGRGPSRAEEEAPFGMASFRVSGAERVLAAGYHQTVVGSKSEILIEHTRPGPGITYTSRPSGPRPKSHHPPHRSPETPSATDVFDTELSPMPRDITVKTPVRTQR